MSKEIKFRVWDKADKVMCDVTYLKFSNVQYMNVGYRKNIGGRIIDENALLDESMSGTCILMQYTGKKDRNSKEIYEGDIVLFTDFTNTENGVTDKECIGKIKWDNESASFYVTDRLLLESEEVFEDCAVIGNIYDNHELLYC